jgi:tetratricopeptide (TPR) repeat protein
MSTFVCPAGRRCAVVTVVVVVTVMGGFAVTPAGAMFMRPDLVDIPVDRLAENLAKLAEENPKDAQARYNLARLHAMAFALKTDATRVWRGQEKRGVWFGHTPKTVPFTNTPTDDPEKLKIAEDHLAKAIAQYGKAVELAPDFLAAQLGHAWCVEQAGKKQEAVDLYRKLITRAWEREGKAQFGGLGGHFITSEAADYLIPLLDADADADEIATLRERSEGLRRLPRPVTPIAIPLSGSLGADDIMDRSSAVLFDADGSGELKQWTWIRSNAGWLVHDPRGRSQITSALQMFGNVTFWLHWDNGYQALAALDNNGDGILRGKELSGLAIWRDSNGNGVSEPGEVLPLADWGIVGLSCKAEDPESGADVAAFSQTGVHFADGSTRPSYDVILKTTRPRR